MLKVAIFLGLLMVLVAALSTTAGAQDLGYGVTCDHVRRLTYLEIKYWKWRYKITAAQVVAIKKRCQIR